MRCGATLISNLNDNSKCWVKTRNVIKAASLPSLFYGIISDGAMMTGLDSSRASTISAERLRRKQGIVDEAVIGPPKPDGANCQEGIQDWVEFVINVEVTVV